MQIFTKAKQNRSKHDLIDMIITERNKAKLHQPENDDLIQEEANLLLKNSNFAKHSKKENNNLIISSEVKAKL